MIFEPLVGSRSDWRRVDLDSFRVPPIADSAKPDITLSNHFKLSRDDVLALVTRLIQRDSSARIIILANIGLLGCAETIRLRKRGW